MTKLSDAEITQVLATLPEWRLEEGSLVRDWTFKDFVEAMEFVNNIGGLAEDEGHHPDIDIRYNRVRLALVTHDAGGITQRDASMATKISREL